MVAMGQPLLYIAAFFQAQRSIAEAYLTSTDTFIHYIPLSSPTVDGYSFALSHALLLTQKIANRKLY